MVVQFSYLSLAKFPRSANGLSRQENWARNWNRKYGIPYFSAMYNKSLFEHFDINVFLSESKCMWCKIHISVFGCRNMIYYILGLPTNLPACSAYLPIMRISPDSFGAKTSFRKMSWLWPRFSVIIILDLNNLFVKIISWSL